LDVEGLVVSFGVDCNGLDPEFTAGPDDTERDFPAVGYEDFIEHRLSGDPALI
jgi:hypothetical protein